MEPLFFGSLPLVVASTKKRTLLTTWKRSFLPPKKTNCQSGPFFDLLPVPFIEERTLTSTNWSKRAKRTLYKRIFVVMTLAFKQMKNWIDSFRKNLEIIVCTVCQKFNFCPKIRFSRNFTNSLIWIFAPKFKRIHEF